MLHGYQWSIVDPRDFVRQLPVRTYHTFPKLIGLVLRGNSRGVMR